MAKRKRNPEKFGIYKIMSKITGEIYIGSAVNVIDRKNKHFSSLRRNKHHNIILQSHVNKYGIDDITFEVIQKIKYEEDLVAVEQFYLDILNPVFNICKIAGSALGLKRTPETIAKMSGKPAWNRGQKTPEDVKDKMKESHAKREKISRPMSDETKEKLRQINLGRPSPNKGKKASPETIKKLVESHLGKKQSEETKIKRGIYEKGKLVSDETREKLSIANSVEKPYRRGEKRSEETKEKMRIAQTGKTHSEETKKKQSEVKIGKYPTEEARKNMSIAQSGRERLPNGTFKPKNSKDNNNAAA